MFQAHLRLTSSLFDNTGCLFWQFLSKLTYTCPALQKSYLKKSTIFYHFSSGWMFLDTHKPEGDSQNKLFLILLQTICLCHQPVNIQQEFPGNKVWPRQTFIVILSNKSEKLALTLKGKDTKWLAFGIFSWELSLKILFNGGFFQERVDTDPVCQMNAWCLQTGIPLTKYGQIICWLSI